MRHQNLASMLNLTTYLIEDFTILDLSGRLYRVSYRYMNGPLQFHAIQSATRLSPWQKMAYDIVVPQVAEQKLETESGGGCREPSL